MERSRITLYPQAPQRVAVQAKATQRLAVRRGDDLQDFRLSAIIVGEA